MARNYEGLLDRAEDLQAFSGYLDSEDRKRLAETRVTFRAEVRVLVYNLYRENPDHGALRVSVLADLERIARANTHSAGAVAEAREALLSGLRARARSHPAIHILIRWGTPFLGLAIFAAYAWFKWRLFQ
jgi:hypothetical protein